MSEKSKTLRLIYIHGFQGDHTSFQSFPTDLHVALLPRLPPGITLESCLYPTYKSKRPISVATSNFLAWLGTQPPGPVILLAHSMGGLLAADAATTPNSPESRRIIGIIAFDVPYLGMHPHVVISGIASLFAGDGDNESKKGENVRVYQNAGKGSASTGSGDDVASLNMPEVGRGVKTEEELNDANAVTFVDRRVVDEWSLYGQTLEVPGDTYPYGHVSAPTSRSPSPSGSQISLEWESYKASFHRRSSSQLSFRSSSPQPSVSPTVTSAHISTVTSKQSTFQSALTSLTNILPPSFISSTNSSTARFLRFLNKHSDEPLRAVVRWIVERFEFGGCMFDPSGLVERYHALERWEGVWVNYWTKTVRGENKEGMKDLGRHFVVLPSSSGLSLVGFNAQIDSSSKSGTSFLSGSRSFQGNDSQVKATQAVRLEPSTVANWERVRILGAGDEVQAHCGLFIRDMNTEYDALVERVARKLEGWVYERVA